MARKKLTDNAGAPVVDNQNIMTAGQRGPVLLQDAWFLEELAHFNREVIPERRMHAKGPALTEHSPSRMTSRNTPGRRFFPRSVKKRTSSPGSGIIISLRVPKTVGVNL
jgi:hypothetical protein